MCSMHSPWPILRKNGCSYLVSATMWEIPNIEAKKPTFTHEQCEPISCENHIIDDYDIHLKHRRREARAKDKQ